MTKPSRYGRPVFCASCIADGRLDSGIGITTSIADGGIVETERIIGVSRYVTRPDQTSCEFSLVVADDCSGKGLGARLMESIMDVARDRGLTEIVGFVLVSNERMLALMRKLGFAIKRYPEDPELRLVSHPL